MKNSMIIRIAFALATYGCQTSTPEGVQKLPDQSLKVTGSSFGGKVGVSADNKIVIRSTTPADDELAALEITNQFARSEATWAVESLDKCLEQIADKRVGGSGVFSESHLDLELIKVQEPAEQLGQDEAGNLVVLREQGFTEKLAQEKKIKSQLNAITKSAKREGVRCYRDLAIARRAHGLKGTQTQAEGYYTKDGVLVKNHYEDGTLDSDFETSAKNETLAKRATSGQD